MIKSGWEQSKKRFEAWWHGECVDRVLLQVTAPKAPDHSPVLQESGNAKPVVESAATPEDLFLDADLRIAMFESHMARTYYGGDAFPYLDTHIGPGTMSLYLGSIPTFAPDTVWYNPCIDDITTADVPKFDENNRFWQATLELMKKGNDRLSGIALVSFPDLIEGLDTIASLVGSDELLIYLVDAPEHVHRFQDALVDRYFDYYDRIYEIIKDEDGGSCFSAFSTWGPGRVAKVQCDFSAMISPKMFEEFVVPYLARQCARLDYSVFHLDGPCCLQHLDLLCSIKELDAIQWTPGAGQPSACDEKYIPLYRQIRQAGKSCMIRGGSPDQARKIVEELGPEGLDIAIQVASPEEADELVKQSFRWGCKQPG
ncbi:MAG: uroporphyrinogen decarboxylase family protein [Armatimonadetes bacterium]|nr:uroporphyrinogen decarboxylase family protein [Armatimonadota bacterium]